MSTDATDKAATRKNGRIRRLWRWFWSPTSKWSLGGLLISGGILGVLFWGGFNTAMEATNTEQFCLSCHQMRNFVYQEYKNTVHYSNRSGVRAVCSDCHVPRSWVHKFARKVKATNELYHHALGTISTREKFEKRRLKLARAVWKTMKETDSRECRNCHNLEAMDLTKQENRSRIRHLTAIKQKMTCIDCHKGVAHQLPAGWDAKEKAAAPSTSAKK